MLLSIILIALVTLGGLGVTYLLIDDEPLMSRIAAGCVIGSGLFGTLLFVIACVFGLSTATALTPLAVTVIPAATIMRPSTRVRFRSDRGKAFGKLQGADTRKILRFGYYLFFFLLLAFFFDRAMYETDQGIFTGGSQNLGDLPFHLGAILSFTEGNNFPPQNPSFAGTKFSYTFIADLTTAGFMKLGAGLRDALFIQDLSWAFALFVLLQRFVLRLTADSLAARLAAPLLFLSGGLGFLWFLSDFWAQSRGFFDLLGDIPGDYTISDQFRWGNSLVSLFLTQRSILLGMPITLMILLRLWKAFADAGHDSRDERPREKSSNISAMFITGVVAGMLPLIHLHSLAVLFIVGAFLLALKTDKWKEWLAFAAGTALVAVPEIVWSMSGSASKTAEFFGIHFGWSAGDMNIVWFWIKNTGLLFPVLALGIYLTWRIAGRESDTEASSAPKKRRKRQKDHAAYVSHPRDLLLFYLPFAFCFILANVARLAPWEWDNIKILIYWFVASIPFIALALAWAFRRSRAWQAAAFLSLIVMTASGSLDVWRTVSGQTNTRVFDSDAVLVAERIRKQTPPNAVFLNAPVYNTATVLSGRLSFIRYTGHLGSHGIDYREREADTRRIYAGGADAVTLLADHGIGYVLVSPEERGSMSANEEFFRRYPVIAEAGRYKVYKTAEQVE